MLFPNHTKSIKNPDYYLIESYLKKLVRKKSNGETLYDPWLILTDFSLSKLLANRIASKIRNIKISGICILADSGIPLGVLLSLALEKPFFIYRRDPWSIDNLSGDRFIFPNPPEGSELIIVDSHITTGYTSSACFDMLNARGISVKGIVAPISFLDLQLLNNKSYKRDVKYISLADSLDYQKLLLELFEVDMMLEVVSKIKKRAAELKKEDDEETQFTPPRIRRFSGLLSSFFRKNSKLPFTILDENRQKNLNNEFSSDESEVWDFLCNRPQGLKILCERVGQEITLNSFPILIGTEMLGSIFSISLAWYNEYEGEVFSTYKPDGMNIKRFHLHTGSYLLVTGRIRTGIFVRGAIEALGKYNLIVAKILVLRLALSGVQTPRNLMIYDSLRRANCEILVIS